MFILNIFLHGMEEPQYLPPPDVRRHCLIASQFERQMKFKPLCPAHAWKDNFPVVWTLPLKCARFLRLSTLLAGKNTALQLTPLLPLPQTAGTSLQTVHEHCQQFRSCPYQLAEGHAVGWQQSHEAHPDFSSHGPALEKHIHLPHPLTRNNSITCAQQELNHLHTETPRTGHMSALSKQGTTINTRAAPWAHGSSPRAARTWKHQLEETSNEQSVPCNRETPSD